MCVCMKQYKQTTWFYHNYICCGFTDKIPLSVAAVNGQYHRSRLQFGKVQLFAFVDLRLVDEVAELVVEWKPGDVDRTVSYRQLELTVPHTTAVGEYLHVVEMTASSLFLCAVTSQLLPHYIWRLLWIIFFVIVCRVCLSDQLSAVCVCAR